MKSSYGRGRPRAQPGPDQEGDDNPSNSQTVQAVPTALHAPFYEEYDEARLLELSQELKRDDVEIHCRATGTPTEASLVQTRIALTPVEAHLDQRFSALIYWLSKLIRAGRSIAFFELPTSFRPLKKAVALPSKHYSATTQAAFKAAATRGFTPEDVFLCRDDEAIMQEGMTAASNATARISQFMLLKGAAGGCSPDQLIVSSSTRLFDDGGRPISSAWDEFEPRIEGEDGVDYEEGLPSVNRGMSPDLVLPGLRGGARGIAYFYAHKRMGSMHQYYDRAMQGALTSAQLTALLERAHTNLDCVKIREERVPTFAAIVFNSVGGFDVFIGNDALNLVWPLAPELLSRPRFPIAAGVDDKLFYVVLSREPYRAYLERAMSLSDPVERRLMTRMLQRVSTSGQCPSAEDRDAWSSVVSRKASNGKLHGLREVADAGAKWIRMCVMFQALCRLSLAYEVPESHEFASSYRSASHLAMVWARRCLNGCLSADALPAFPEFLEKEVHRAGATLVNIGQEASYPGVRVDDGAVFAPYCDWTLCTLASIVDLGRLPVRRPKTTVATAERQMTNNMQSMNAVSVASQLTSLDPAYIAEMQKSDERAVKFMNDELRKVRAEKGPQAVPRFAQKLVHATSNKADARNPRSGSGKTGTDLQLILACLELGVSDCPLMPGITERLQFAREDALSGEASAIKTLGELMEIIHYFSPYAEQLLVYETSWDAVPDATGGVPVDSEYPGAACLEIESKFKIDIPSTRIERGYFARFYPEELPPFRFLLDSAGRKIIKPMFSSASAIAPPREGNSPQVDGVDNSVMRHSKLRTFAAVTVNGAARRVTPLAKAIHAREFPTAQQVISGPSDQIPRMLSRSLDRARALAKRIESGEATDMECVFGGAEDEFVSETDGTASTDPQTGARMRLHLKKYSLAPDAYWGATTRKQLGPDGEVRYVSKLTPRGKVLKAVTLAGLRIGTMPMMLAPRVDMPPRMRLSWMHLDDGVTETREEEYDNAQEIGMALNCDVHFGKRRRAGYQDSDSLTPGELVDLVADLLKSSIFNALEASAEFSQQIVQNGSRFVALFPTSWGKSTRLVRALSESRRVLVISPKGGAIVSAANDMARHNPNMLVRADAYVGPYKWQSGDYATVRGWSQGVCIVTDSNARMALEDNLFDVVLIDECHKMRGVLGYLSEKHIFAVTASELGAREVSKQTGLPLIDMRSHVVRNLEITRREFAHKMLVDEAMAAEIRAFATPQRFSDRPIMVALCPTVTACQNAVKAFGIVGFEAYEFHGDMSPQARLDLQTRKFCWPPFLESAVKGNSPVVICCSNAAREGIHFENEVAGVVDYCIVGESGHDARDNVGFVRYYAANADSLLQGIGRAGRKNTRYGRREVLYFRVTEPRFRGETLRSQPVGALEVSLSACIDMVANGYEPCDYPFDVAPLELANKFTLARYLQSQPKRVGGVSNEMAVSLAALDEAIEQRPSPRQAPDGEGLSDREYRELVEKMKDEDATVLLHFRRSITEAFYTLALMQTSSRVERDPDLSPEQREHLHLFERLCTSGNPASAAWYLITMCESSAQARALKCSISRLASVLDLDPESEFFWDLIPRAFFNAEHDRMSGETVYKLVTFTPLSLAAAHICAQGFPGATCLYDARTSKLLSPIYGRTSYVPSADQLADPRLTETAMGMCCYEPALREGVARPRLTFVVGLSTLQGIAKALEACSIELVIPMPSGRARVPTISHMWRGGTRTAKSGDFPLGFGVRPRKSVSDRDEALAFIRSWTVLPQDVIMTAVDPMWHHADPEWDAETLTEYDLLRRTDAYGWRRFCVREWLRKQPAATPVAKRAGGWVSLTITCRKAWPRWKVFGPSMLPAYQAMSWIISMSILTSTQAVAVRAGARKAALRAARFMLSRGVRHPAMDLLGPMNDAALAKVQASVEREIEAGESSLVSNTPASKNGKNGEDPDSANYGDDEVTFANWVKLVSYEFGRFSDMFPSLKKSELHAMWRASKEGVRFSGYPIVYYIGRFYALLRRGAVDAYVKDVPAVDDVLDAKLIEAPLVRIAMKRGSPLPTIPNYTEGAVFDTNPAQWSEKSTAWARVCNPGIEELKNFRCLDAPPAAGSLFSSDPAAPAVPWTVLKKLANERVKTPGQAYVARMVGAYKRRRKPEAVTAGQLETELDKRVDVEAALAPLLNLTAPSGAVVPMRELCVKVQEHVERKDAQESTLPATHIASSLFRGVAAMRRRLN